MKPTKTSLVSSEIADTKFGVETEFFLVSCSGQRCPSLEQMDRLFRLVAKSPNWQIGCDQESGLATECLLSSPHGVAIIKNDFSTNIIEVAFPPLSSPQNFREIFQSVDRVLVPALESQNLKVLPGTVGDFKAEEIVLRPPPNEAYRQRLDFDIKRLDNGQPLFDPYFYGNICSTQVSLSISREEWRPIAERLYDYEYLVPLLFSTPSTTKGITRHCLRHFLYEHNWPKDPYMGFPIDVSGLVAAADLDPEPQTLKFAYCVSRDEHRVEFRSCDRLDDAETILEMIFLRLANYLAAKKGLSNQPKDRFPDFDRRSAFESVCRVGTVPSIDSPRPDFEIVLKTFGSKWSGTHESLAKKFLSMLAKDDSLTA